MPLYEFINKEHGVRVDVIYPVNERPASIVRDGIVLTRATVPSRITVGVGAKPPTFTDKLRKGYKEREEAGDFRGKRKPGYLSDAQIKKALAMPDTD